MCERTPRRIGPDGIASRLLERRVASLPIRLDLDPGLSFFPDERLFAALDVLVALAEASAPAGTELYLSLSRPPARLALADACDLTARWQVRGEDPVGAGTASVRPLRPGIQGARAVAGSVAAHDAQRAFEGAGWRLEIGAVGTADEVWARARRLRGAA